MSAREGFYRLTVIYNRRWWIIVLAPSSMFIYAQLKHRPPEADPVTWNLLGAALSTVLTVSALIVIVWVIVGFLQPEPQPTPSLAQKAGDGPWS